MYKCVLEQFFQNRPICLYNPVKTHVFLQKSTMPLLGRIFSSRGGSAFGGNFKLAFNKNVQAILSQKTTIFFDKNHDV